MESYRLSTRITSGEKEYLLQTASDLEQKRILTSIFSEGELLQTMEDDVAAGLQETELRDLVKTTHKEHQDEFEFLFARLKSAFESDDIDQINYLGVALTHKRMYGEAEALFRRALEIDTDAHESRNYLGHILMLRKHYKEAADIFARCVELRPQFADYHNNLGEAFLALKSCKRAMIEFDEAVGLNLYYGDAYFNKALTYVLNAILREDFKLFSEYNQKTVEMMERATVICPEYRNEHYQQGRKLLEDGELEEAYAHLLACRDTKKRIRFRDFSNVYMKFLLNSDKLDERTLSQRIKKLKQEISHNPHYPDLHYDLAVAYTLLGRFIHSKAVDEYRQALKLNPDFDRARKNLKLAENEFKGFDALVRAVTKG